MPRTARVACAYDSLRLRIIYAAVGHSKDESDQRPPSSNIDTYRRSYISDYIYTIYMCVGEIRLFVACRVGLSAHTLTRNYLRRTRA